MSAVQRLVRRFAKEERGQIAIMFALLFMVLLGMVAIVIDFGNLYMVRRRAQNAADAAALAGARELPDNPTLAQSVAKDYTALNGFTDGINGVEVTTQVYKTYYQDPDDPSKVDTIEVTVRNTQTGLFLAHIPFGGDNFRSVAATAVGIVGSLGKAAAMPWGIALRGTGDCCVGGVPCDCDGGACDGTLLGEGCVDPQDNPGSLEFGFQFGVQYKIKLGPGFGGQGNYQGLAIDGSGGNVYRDTIANGGSQNRISVCECVPNETGALAGPTLDGLCTLMGGTVTTLPGGTKICTGGDTHLVEQMITPPCGACFYKDLDQNGTYETAVCAPPPPDCGDMYTIHNHADGSECPRLVLVPIVKEYPSGSSEDVVILGFSVFFIENFERNGSDMDIWGYFIDCTVPGSWAAYQPAFGARVVKLFR